jgi:streptogramin lyase
VRIVVVAAVALLVGPALARANDLTEYPLALGSHPAELAVGPDTNLWFTDSGSASVGATTTGGHMLSGFPTSSGITAGANPQGIVRGPDGNVWFAESANNAVGRITPDGTVTEFSLSGLQANSGPAEIAAGPNGMLYFTEAKVGRIGRINPLAGTTGAIFASLTESAVVPSGSGSGLSGIVAGDDGKLWFTEQTSSRVGNITPDLSTTNEFISGITAMSSPREIVAGPDGALWFTEFASNQIGRITTAGAVSEFPVPTPGSGPLGITLGPDGALWFTEGTASQVGRIDASSHAVSEFALPRGSSPQGIIAGPDGAVWFAEVGRDEIGRLTATSRPVVSTSAASGIGQSSATLAGSVDPEGQTVSDCRFEYGTTTAYGSYAPCTPAVGGGSGAVAVSAQISGLEASTPYHFRIVATNATGTGAGADQTFTTAVGGVSQFQLLKPTIRGNKLVVIVVVPVAGSISATGSAHALTGSKRASLPYGQLSRVATSPGAVALTLSPSAAAKRLLRKGRRLGVSIAVTFTPAGGTPSTKRVSSRIG